VYGVRPWDMGRLRAVELRAMQQDFQKLNTDDG
jgi:hypothetical protein